MSNDLLALALDALKTCVMTEGVTGWEYLYDIQKVEEAIAALEAAQSQPVPPHECKTEAEKKAYAFGWWKALESVQAQPVGVPAGWVMEQDIIRNQNVAETLERAGEKIVQITAAPATVPPGDEMVQEIGSDYDIDERMDEVRPLQQYPTVSKVELPVVAYQSRFLDMSDNSEGWSSWRNVDPQDVEFWKRRCATSPDFYELRGLIVQAAIAAARGAK